MAQIQAFFCERNPPVLPFPQLQSGLTEIPPMTPNP